MTAVTGNTAGDTADLLLREADYAYGTGVLRLRVVRVDRAHPVSYHGDIWYRVDGVQLTAAGTEIGGQREVLVRARRLPS